MPVIFNKKPKPVLVVLPPEGEPYCQRTLFDLVGSAPLRLRRVEAPVRIHPRVLNNWRWSRAQKLLDLPHRAYYDERGVQSCLPNFAVVHSDESLRIGHVFFGAIVLVFEDEPKNALKGLYWGPYPTCVQCDKRDDDRCCERDGYIYCEHCHLKNVLDC